MALLEPSPANSYRIPSSSKSVAAEGRETEAIGNAGVKALLWQGATQPFAALRKFAALKKIGAAAKTRYKIRNFRKEYEVFKALSAKAGRTLSVNRDDFYPCLNDRLTETPFDRHYIYHPAWAARVLARTRPAKHVDISSILNFCTIVSAFIPVEFYDFRPAPLKLHDLRTGAANLSRLDFADGSISSLSCMHVIEHLGLGRYGEPLDPNADIKAIRELVRVLAPGGNLLVAVPVGRPRIRYNAHRIYDFSEFRNYFVGLEMVEFALIPDGDATEGLIYNPPDGVVGAQNYACGCYWFKKVKSTGC